MTIVEEVKVRFGLQHRAWLKDSERMQKQNDLVWKELDRVKEELLTENI